MAEQAAKLVKEGKKLAKGGWFSGPDPEGASRKFEAAAKALRPLGPTYTPQLVEALELAASAHETCGSYHSAGKSLTAAAQALEKEEKREDEVAGLYARASGAHRMTDHHDLAAGLLVKAGQAVAATDPDLAYDYYGQAIAVFEEEGRAKFANDTVKKIQNDLLARNEIARAIEVMERHNKLYMTALDSFERYLYKNMLSIVVCLYHQGKYAEAAAKVSEYQRTANFTVSPECDTANAVMSAASEEDLAAAVASATVRHLDNRIARLAGKLQFSADAAAAQNASAEAFASAPETIEADDELADLR